MTANKKSGLLRLVEEKALSKKQQLNLIPYLPKEIISNILLRLPPEFLQSSRFVCKSWHNVTLTHNFIDTHLQELEPVLIFETLLDEESSQENRKRFSVESKLLQRNTPLNLFPEPEKRPSSVYCLKFVAVKDGNFNICEFDITCLGKIRATCNGLILLDNKMNKGELIVMNPLTKESYAFPRGTLFPPSLESYGFVYCKGTREYKVVHLFIDNMNFVSCEVLNLGTRTWKAIDGPTMGLFTWFECNPVSAIGSLHWIPDRHSDFIVSMAIDEEKFHKTMLPVPIRAGRNDRILEMGGFLCFLTHQQAYKIDVFVLKELNGEDWTKKCSITSDIMEILVPLYVRLKEGEIVFKNHNGFFYSYDLRLRIFKEVDMKEGFKPCYGTCFPHVNSIVSLQKVENGKDLW